MDRFKRLTLVPLVLFAGIVFALLIFNGRNDPADELKARQVSAPRIESRPLDQTNRASYVLDEAPTTPVTSESIDLYRVLSDSLGQSRSEMIPAATDDPPLAQLGPAPPTASLQAPIFFASFANPAAAEQSATASPDDRESTLLPPMEWPSEPIPMPSPIDRLPPVPLESLTAPPHDTSTTAINRSPAASGMAPSPSPTLPATTSTTPAAEEPQQSILMYESEPLDRTPPRVSPAMVEQVRDQIEQGVVLLRKGALYSARNELFHALYLLAEAQDSQSGQRTATQHLSNAITALNESDDFVRLRDSGEFFIDLTRMTSRHDTAVLDGSSSEPMTPLVALKKYYEFAQEELINASGGEEVAAEALFALGKLYSMPAGLGDAGEKLPGPKAIVMFQASVRIDPGHARSANELAVLLARHGEYKTAKQLLLQSLRNESTPAGWHNLAWVHQQLGEGQLARLAALEEQAVKQQSDHRLATHQRVQTSGITFVPPQQFDRGRPPVASPGMSGPPPMRQVARAPAEPNAWWKFWAE